MNRPPQIFKVSRGHWRTRDATRKLLEVPPSVALPGYICKLPLFGLDKLRLAALERMQAKQREAAAPPERTQEEIEQYMQEWEWEARRAGEEEHGREMQEANG